jgi:hypothetical protein
VRQRPVDDEVGEVGLVLHNVFHANGLLVRA